MGRTPAGSNPDLDLDPRTRIDMNMNMGDMGDMRGNSNNGLSQTTITTTPEGNRVTNIFTPSSATGPTLLQGNEQLDNAQRAQVVEEVEAVETILPNAGEPVPTRPPVIPTDGNGSPAPVIIVPEPEPESELRARAEGPLIPPQTQFPMEPQEPQSGAQSESQTQEQEIQIQAAQAAQAAQAQSVDNLLPTDFLNAPIPNSQQGQGQGQGQGQIEPANPQCFFSMDGPSFAVRVWVSMLHAV